MNLTEYKQKKRECWEEFRAHVVCGTDDLKGWVEHIFDRAYVLGKEETKQETDVEGEEMLSTSKTIAFKLYDIANGSYRENGNEWFHGYMKAMVDLFGNIFPPVERTKESKEPEPAEPSSQNSPENCDNADLISTDCDKQFDTILKDSFSKERRLNIAAMAMRGILSNPQLLKITIETYQEEIGSPDFFVATAKAAKAQADALIAECNTPIN